MFVTPRLLMEHVLVHVISILVEKREVANGIIQHIVVVAK